MKISQLALLRHNTKRLLGKSNQAVCPSASLASLSPRTEKDSLVDALCLSSLKNYSSSRCLITKDNVKLTWHG